MEIKINRKEFLNILSETRQLTTEKTNLAITSAVLLTTENDKLKISATDLNMYYQNFCFAKIIKPGQITIPFKELYSFVQKSKDFEIHMGLESERWLKISNKTTNLNIACLDPEDFPFLPELDYNKMVEIGINDLKEMIDKTIVIGPYDSTNPYMPRAYIAGVYFKTTKYDDKNYIRMVSTNGSQLNLIDKECSDIELEKGVLIPKKYLSKLNKMILQIKASKKSGKITPFFEIKPENNISIGVNQDYFIVKKSNATIIIRLLEGEFPDYENLISEHDKNIIIADKENLLDIMKQMVMMQDADYKAGMITIENDVLKMVFDNPNIGTMEKEINVEYKGKLIEVKYPPNQFAEILNVMNSQKIELNIKDGETPCIITGEQDDKFFALIMPHNY